MKVTMSEKKAKVPLLSLCRFSIYQNDTAIITYNFEPHWRGIKQLRYNLLQEYIQIVNGTPFSLRMLVK